MKTSIFEYRDYKAFLNDLILSYPKKGHGLRRKLAEFIRCQEGYITHVLSGEHHFSAENAEAVARFFGLSFDETEFFLLLVAQNRAGTSTLKTLYTKLVDLKVEQSAVLKKRLEIHQTLSREDQAIYYSSWHYAVIHMLLTIPKFRRADEISARLQLRLERVLEVLEFFLKTGIAEKKQNQYFPKLDLLHLEKDSPYLPRHHTNFRLRSIDSFDRKGSMDLHYSLVFSIAKADAPRVRERLIKALEDCAEIIKPSACEEVSCLALDFFDL